MTLLMMWLYLFNSPLRYFHALIINFIRNLFRLWAVYCFLTPETGGHIVISNFQFDAFLCVIVQFEHVLNTLYILCGKWRVCIVCPQNTLTLLCRFLGSAARQSLI